MALFVDLGTNKCQIKKFEGNERVSLEIFGAFPEIIQYMFCYSNPNQ